MRASYLIIWLLGGLCLLATSTSRAQLILGPDGPKYLDADQSFASAARAARTRSSSITFDPAGAPVPALKYRLWAPSELGQPGNAAPFYYRALLAYVPQQRQALEFEKLMELIDVPLSELPDDAEEIQRAFEHAYSELVVASRRKYCDWDWQLERLEGRDAYNFLLHDAQEMRNLARMLAIRIRLAVRRGDFQQAAEDLRIGYKMAYDTAQPPLLVSALIGAAIADMMNQRLLEMISAPQAPNMYWALTALPEPLIDLTRSLDFETQAIFRIYPMLDDPAHQRRASEEWHDAWHETLIRLAEIGGFGASRHSKPDAWQSSWTVLRAFPLAKQALLDDGFDAQKLDAMPAGQVVAIHQSRYLHRVIDEIRKWAAVSHPEAIIGLNRLSRQLAGNARAELGEGGPEESVPMAEVLFSAIIRTKVNDRVQTHLRLLRVVEAVRAHTAATGRLPDSLEEIDIVPIPANPITGRPYEFQRDGDTITLGYEAMDWSWYIQMTLNR